MFTIKVGPDGSIDQLKAHLVAKGYTHCYQTCKLYWIIIKVYNPRHRIQADYHEVIFP